MLYFLHFKIIFNTMLGNSPSELITIILTLVISFTFHEFAHAWTATQFGDDTPARFGRLTLNPMKHLDLMGSLMLVLTGFGWAKPVPVNKHKIAQHSSAALMLVAVSGPLSNFLLAAAAAVPLRFGWVQNSMPYIDLLPTGYEFLIIFLFTNLGLMLFNLIPLPPLDGEEVLAFLLPPRLEEQWEKIRMYGPYILIILLVVGPMFGLNIFDAVISPAVISIAEFLLGV
jgi:Zn-dependent protease